MRDFRRPLTTARPSACQEICAMPVSYEHPPSVILLLVDPPLTMKGGRHQGGVHQVDGGDHLVYRRAIILPWCYPAVAYHRVDRVDASGVSPPWIWLGLLSIPGELNYAARAILASISSSSSD